MCGQPTFECAPMSLCVCVCVCVFEGGGGGDRDRARERERETDRDCPPPPYIACMIPVRVRDFLTVLVSFLLVLSSTILS